MSKIHLMSLRHSAFYTPYLMTMAGGFLRAQGLDYDYAVATPERGVPDSLRDGSAHLSQSAVATSFAALERGEVVDIVHFAQINARDGFFLAAREPQPDFRWSDLKGKRVLVDHFFQPLAMLKYGLHRQGMGLDDFEVIDAGDVAAIEQAFRNGEGDYVHMQGPAPQQLEHEGLAQVAAAVGDAVGPVAFSSLCATRAWLETDMAVAFMQAYRAAQRYVLEAPAEELAAREQEAGFFRETAPAVLTATIRAYQGLGCWSDEPAIPREAYDNLLEVFLFDGLLRQRHPYEAAISAPPA